MPANMISAPVGSSFTVNGSSIATVSAGPTPGSTPIAVPSVTPTKPHSRFVRRQRDAEAGQQRSSEFPS